MWKVLLPALASMMYMDGENTYNDETGLITTNRQTSDAFLQDLRNIALDQNDPSSLAAESDDINTNNADASIPNEPIDSDASHLNPFFQRTMRRASSMLPAFNQHRREVLEQAALQHFQATRGLNGDDDQKHSRRSLCPLVCGYCDKVATKRLAVLCTHECHTDELGYAYDRCLILWLDGHVFN